MDLSGETLEDRKFSAFKELYIMVEFQAQGSIQDNGVEGASLLELFTPGIEHWLHHKLCAFEPVTSLSLSFLVCEIVNNSTYNREG